MKYKPLTLADPSDPLDDLKAALEAGLSLVPEVGGILDTLVELFWPSSGTDPEAIWNAIKDHVKSLIQDMIDDQKVEDMHKKLQGLGNDLEIYRAEPLGTPEKGTLLDGVILNIANTEQYFFDPVRPWETLPYFIAMATLMVSVLRERVLFYKEIWGKEATSEADTVHRQQLKDRIDKYTAGIPLITPACMDWRLGKIHRETTDVEDGKLGIYDRTHDDGVDPPWQSEPYTRLVHPEWNPEFAASQEAIAAAILEARKEDVRKDYQAALDKVTGPAQLWPKMDGGHL